MAGASMSCQVGWVFADPVLLERHLLRAEGIDKLADPRLLAVTSVITTSVTSLRSMRSESTFSSVMDMNLM
jgi:hypothetical protein